MKLFSKIAIAAIAASSILSAAEVLDLTAQGFWQNTRNITYGEKEMTPAGKLLFISKKLLTIDPSKKYMYPPAKAIRIISFCSDSFLLKPMANNMKLSVFKLLVILSLSLPKMSKKATKQSLSKMLQNGRLSNI